MPRKKRYYSLPEEMTKDIWEDEEAFYDDLEEAWSWYSPTSSYTFIQDPTAENFAKAAWVPTLSLGTYMGFNYAMLGHGGMPHLSYWSANVWQSRVSTMRWAAAGVSTGVRYGAHLGRGALRAGYRAVPLAGVVLGVMAYWDHLQDLDWMPDIYQV